VVEESIEIAATPERVWAVMENVERWPEWTASMRSVRRLDTGPFAVGSRVRIQQPGFPPAVWKVNRLEPGREFTWVASGPGFQTTGLHRVEPVGEGRSRVTLGIENKGPLAFLMSLFAGKTQRYVRMEAEGLKARAEAPPA
jgi:uncharacterized membrane protein